MTETAGGGNGATLLTSRERSATREVIRRVRRYVPAELLHVLLFGSKARGTARPDSDLDLLLIFRELPPDREPQASIAEVLAEQVADEAGVPVSPWSVALIDLQRGMRTPMLVDALADGVPLWPVDLPCPRPGFTPEDALRCATALLERVTEGSAEFAYALAAVDPAAAARRARDDIVRLCTAALLLEGETRPRRASAVRRFAARERRAGNPGRETLFALEWAANSFGPDGKDEDREVPPPPGGLARAADCIDLLRMLVQRRGAALALRARGNAARLAGYERGNGFGSDASARFARRRGAEAASV